MCAPQAFCVTPSAAKKDPKDLSKASQDQVSLFHASSLSKLWGQKSNIALPHSI
jgi:hypothetical protein